MRRLTPALRVVPARSLIWGLAFLGLLVGLPSLTASAQDGGSADPAPAQEQPAEEVEKPAEAEKPAETEEAAGTDAADSDDGNGRRDPSQRDLSAYRLRVGDTLDIQVYQHAEFSRTYTVPGNGQVSFHPIGKIDLLDQTVFEVEAEIRRRLRSEEILTDPRVSVVVVQFSPRNVFLIGAVQGTVPLPTHKNVRVLQLLAMAGGLGNPTADFSNVTIRRTAADGTSYNIEISVADILQRNDEQKNVIVFEDDIIYVPVLQSATPLSADWVYVLGKVGSPGRHAITKGRTGFTLTKCIALAGDFQEFANRSKVTIIRKTDTGRQRFIVDFDEIIEGKRPDVDLQPDDLIYVSETFF